MQSSRLAPLTVLGYYELDVFELPLLFFRYIPSTCIAISVQNIKKTFKKYLSQKQSHNIIKRRFEVINKTNGHIS